MNRWRIGCSSQLVNYFNSPVYYCRGVPSTIFQTPISGVNPQYSWEFPNLNYPNIAPSSNNSTSITFNTTNQTVFLKYVAQSQSHTRYYFRNVLITPIIIPYSGLGYRCQSTGVSIPYGNSQFDYEYYDFGLDATPQNFSTTGNGSVQNITVNYSSSGSKIITRTYSNANGDCNRELLNVIIDGSCRMAGKSASFVFGQKNTGILLSPNPASSFVSIGNSEETILNLQVYSFDGKLLKSIPKISKTNYRLNIQDLSNGNYYVKMVTTKNSYTEKLVVLK